MSLLPVAIDACLRALPSWQALSLPDRLSCVRRFRHRLVASVDPLTQIVEREIQRPPVEVIGTDILPTAAACRYLESRAAKILAPRRVLSAPMWLMGCRDQLHHRPHGLVAVIGTWNYPIFLNLVPILQAVVAGNTVLWKPSELVPESCAFLHRLLQESGFPDGLIALLPAQREIGPELIESPIDFLHFTGSETVGRKIATRLGERLIPSSLELSGCDMMLVLADADVKLAARAACFGATLNVGQTCMGTRRVWVDPTRAQEFLEHLVPLVEHFPARPLQIPASGELAEAAITEAKNAGARIIRGSGAVTGDGFRPALILEPPLTCRVWTESHFAPLLSVTSVDRDPVELHNDSRWGLTASIFTSNNREAESIAARLRVGAVIVNDVIAPAAHPDTPFGGRRSSGWGVTQGAEGLRKMTLPQVVTLRSARFRPHIDQQLEPNPATEDVLRGMLRFTHSGSLRERCSGLVQMFRGMRNSVRKS